MDYPSRLRELSMSAWLSEVDAIMLEEAASEIDRLRNQELGDSVAEVMNANRSPEPHRTAVQDEVDRLHAIIKDFIKAEQDMNQASTDYFALDCQDEMTEALEVWKNAFKALEDEARRV